MNKITYDKLVESAYGLEDLIEAFQKHVIQSHKNHEKLKKAFKQNNPDGTPPDHLINEFNLPRALLSLCIEINELKKQLNHLSDEYHGYDP